MRRVHNFNPGPAALPLPALELAHREFFDFNGSGMSIMEHSHRGKDYEAVHNEAINLLRELFNVPDNYKILFLQGGASLQFSMVPMNFLHPGKTADYIITGTWSQKALKEAQILNKIGWGGTPNIAASTEQDKKFTRIPKQNELKLNPDAAYVHTTSNNTIFGTQWHWWPETGNVPHICDMSSDIFSRKIDVSRFALIYAGAQKNLGPSGVTVVIIREDMLSKCREGIPTMLYYPTHAKENSLYNTPPTFGIYILRNVLRWAKEAGGLEQIEKWNEEKANILYGAIDASNGYYRGTADKDSRSKMNVTFRLPSEELEEKFIAEGKKHDFVGMKGHRSVGGIRVSLYNAVTVDSIKALVGFMEKFQKENKPRSAAAGA